MSFIQNIEQEPNKRNLFKSIINLAHGLNMEAVAERVETEEQLQIVIEQGCDVVQGFYLGKPVVEQEAKKLMAHAQNKPASK